MPKHATNGYLASVMADFENMQQSPALMILLESKIRRFYEQNGVKINSVKSGLNDLIGKYVKKDEKGQPMIAIDNQNRPTYVFHSEEDKATFEKEKETFLAQPCRIEV